MKRQWGFNHIMTKKSKKHASADVGFIFIAYNLKRIMNIIGISQLITVITSIFLYFDKFANYKNHKNTHLSLNALIFN